MQFIQNTKIKIGLGILKTKIKKLSRNRGVFNLNNAKNIGIIYNATNQTTYNTALKFIKYLQEKNIKVNSLGFVNSKEVLNFYETSSDVDFFSKNNLNWYGKPNNPNTNEFIEKEFDVLIDLSLVDDFPLQYIVALSKAKFKVGRYTTDEGYYDFMINVEEKKEIDFLIDQIKHYLTMIKWNVNKVGKKKVNNSQYADCLLL